METHIRREYTTEDGKVFDNENEAYEHEDQLNAERVYFENDADAYEYIEGGVSFCEMDHEMNGYRLRQALEYLKKWYDAYLKQDIRQ